MQTPPFIVIHKQRGETPLEALEAWRATRPELADLPLAYAGRLDPMASGKLLVLIGDECKRQRLYHGLDKEYEVEVLFGIATDTGDTLGLPALSVHSQSDASRYILRHRLENAVASLVGTSSVPYPAFSSKVVDGKPLFLRALEGTLDPAAIPHHQETIHRMTVLGMHSYTTEELATRIQADLASVPRSDEPSKVLGADFRQDAIRAAWKEVLTQSDNRTWQSVTIRVISGPGAYMRTLTGRLAGELSTSGLALSIKRTRIGRYWKLGPFGLWIKEF